MQIQAQLNDSMYKINTKATKTKSTFNVKGKSVRIEEDFENISRYKDDDVGSLRNSFAFNPK